MWQCILRIEWAEGGTLGEDASMANLRGIAAPVLRESWRQNCGMNSKEELVDEY